MADPIGIAGALILQFEGCRLMPYLDPAGVPTIGVGCTYLADGSRVTMNTPALPDPAAAYALLDAKLAGVASDVRHIVRVDLADHQWAALFSFAYNVGPGAFSGSTVCHLVNAAALAAEVAPHFGSWIYAHGPDGRMIALPGLRRRRAAEAACWLGAAVPTPTQTAQPARSGRVNTGVTDGQ